MSDKTATKTKSRGREYCDVPGTSCQYDGNEVCVHCGRIKGWRRGTVTLRQVLTAVDLPAWMIDNAKLDRRTNIASAQVEGDRITFTTI